MHYINFGVAIMLFVIGWLIKVKKMTWLIAGYNTAPKEEKDTYDIDKLTKHMGNFIYILAITWALMAAMGVIFPERFTSILFIGIGVFTVEIIAGVIFLNTGNRVKKD